MTEPTTPRKGLALLLTATLTIVLAACGASGASLPALPSGGGGALGSAAAGASGRPSVPELPSVEPSQEATAKPTTAPTVKPTAKPTDKPTAEPTAKATSNPTAVPTPTPLIATTTCTTSDGAIKNTYPVEWKTVVDLPEFTCMFFDRLPILIDANSGYPLAPIHVVAHDNLTFNAAVLATTDTKYWRSVSRTPMTIGGLPAVLVVAIANGAGSFPRDTERYGWIIDWGPNGVIIMQTTGPEGDTQLSANKLVLDLMAKNIKVKANP